MRGNYYERVREDSRSYYLLDDAPVVYQYSHLVVASKFSIPPTTHFMKGRYRTYESTLEIADIINAGIAAYKLADVEDSVELREVCFGKSRGV